MKGSFIEKVDYLLTERQLSKRQFAEELGINKNQMHRWETGANIPYKRTVKMIADYFMVVPQSLVEPDMDIEYTYTATPLTPDFNFLPLTEQEREILSMYRDSSASKQLRMIQAIMNIYDKEYQK